VKTTAKTRKKRISSKIGFSSLLLDEADLWYFFYWREGALGA